MDDETGPQDGQLPLHGVGDRLRLAREKSGMSLEQLAAETRIPQRHLELIEAGDFAALPARTYATGFTRTYAKAVGLDDGAIIEEVRTGLAMSAGAERGRVETFEPGDPARVPSRGLAMFSLAAIVLLLAGGYMFYDRVLAPGSGPASLLDEQRAAATPATKRVAAAPADGPVVFTSLDDGVWVKFYDAAGTQIMQKEMAKGETFTVPADADGPQVWTGRPEALAITIGGKSVPKLADEQRIVRDVPVTAAALLARATAAAEPVTDAAATTQVPSARPAPRRTTRPAPAPRRTSAPRVSAPEPPSAPATVSTPVVQPVPAAPSDGAGTAEPQG